MSWWKKFKKFFDKDIPDTFNKKIPGALADLGGKLHKSAVKKSSPLKKLEKAGEVILPDSFTIHFDAEDNGFTAVWTVKEKIQKLLKKGISYKNIKLSDLEYIIPDKLTIQVGASIAFILSCDVYAALTWTAQDDIKQIIEICKNNK